MNQRICVGLIGWGAIGQTVAQLLRDEPVEIGVIGVRDADAERTGVPRSAALITSPNELADFNLHVVAEAAGRDGVSPWGRATLTKGTDFIVSSVSAFADDAVLRSLSDAAQRNGARLEIHPGACAGIDALAGAKKMGLDHVEHRIVKAPVAWRGTHAEELCDLDSIAEPTVFYTASARDTAQMFPKNANVAMTTALAGVGPDATTITLVVDPNAPTNRHEIRAHGAFGALDLAIANKPLPANPKTSAMAALSLARAIQNRTAGIVI